MAATKTATRAKPKTGSRATRRTKAVSASQDAIALRKADHREVTARFDQFEKTEEDDAKGKLAREICATLTVHAQIEEEIFDPAAHAAIEDDDPLDEAEVEHASAKDLIVQIEASAPGEPLFDAKVKVLGEYINHPVEEEERELFPECRSSKMDLKALGEPPKARKQELLAAKDQTGGTWLIGAGVAEPGAGQSSARQPGAVATPHSIQAAILGMAGA